MWSPHEDPETCEERALRWLQQIMAPGDGGAQGLLSRREVACPAREDRQPLIEPRQERGRGQQAHAGGGQLDREREAVQPLADRYHVGDIVRTQTEGGFDRLGAFDKETDCRRSECRLGREDG